MCKCDSSYCDYYPDPSSPNKGEFILYSTSKNGKRLERSEGKISKEIGNGYSVKINAKIQYQKIEGFGGSFTDAATMNIKSLSLSTQNHLMRHESRQFYVINICQVLLLTSLIRL